MGWGNCGADTQGRPIGYSHPAMCDHPGCNAKINRGLSYACGGMHGEDTRSCERYFCEAHLSGWIPVVEGSYDTIRVCAECEAAWRRDCPKEAAVFDEQ